MNTALKILVTVLLVALLAMPVSSHAGSGGGGNRQIQIQIQTLVEAAFLGFTLVQALVLQFIHLALTEPGWAIVAILGAIPILVAQPPPEDVAKLDAVKINPGLPVPEGLL